MMRLGLTTLIGLASAVPVGKVAHPSTLREAAPVHSAVLSSSTQHSEAPLSPSSRRAQDPQLLQERVAEEKVEVAQKVEEEKAEKVGEATAEEQAQASVARQKQQDRGASAAEEDKAEDCPTGDCFGAFEPSAEYKGCMSAVPNFPEETTKRAWQTGCWCHDAKLEGGCHAFCDPSSKMQIRLFIPDANGEGGQKYTSSILKDELAEDGNTQYPVIAQCISGCQARGVCKGSAGDVVPPMTRAPTASTDAPTVASQPIEAFEKHPGKYCAGRNEVYKGKVADQSACEAKCLAAPTCVSYEWIATASWAGGGTNVCQASSSCTTVTMKDNKDGVDLYTKVEAKSRANVECTFTADDEIVSVEYDGSPLHGVHGALDESTQTKSVTFAEVPGAELVITAFNLEKKNNCQTGGFAFKCTHKSGESTKWDGLEAANGNVLASGSKDGIAYADFAPPCTSTAGFSFPDSGLKVWAEAAPDNNYARFKIAPP